MAGALRRWFRASEQVETALALEVVPAGAEPLGQVAALLVQRLPGGEAAAVVDAGDAIGAGAFGEALAAGASALAVIEAVAGPGFELLAEQEVAYRCGCGLDRVKNAVTALGADGIADLAATVGRAEVDCEFCHAHYVLEADVLRDLERRLREATGAG
jgi:molecular chaperone Hsp33